MIDLFSAAGRAAIEALASTKTLYAFDFDGTLSPIVARPDAARAAPTTIALLSALGTRASTLLLTGRAADDLRQRIDFVPTWLVGNHGAEGMPDELADRDGLAAARAIVDGWRTQWPARLAADHVAGIELESKAYSLSIHVRAAVDQAAAARQVVEAIDRLDPRPHVIGGKCVFNLLPEGAPDKGRALAALVAFEGCAAAFFIGDDVTDESVFAMAPPSWVTVRVGQSVDSAARYFIAAQHDIDRCLATLVDAVEAGAA